MKQEQVVFILGGGILEEGGVWRTTHFTEKGDAFGALGDRLRVDAAFVLYQAHPETTLLVPSGSKGQLKDHLTAPTVASVMGVELETLGVPDKAILLDEVSGNSYQQLCTLVLLAEEYDWKHIVVLTNSWHLPRVQTMVDVTDSLRTFFLKRKISFVAAEEILIEADTVLWQKVIEDAYSDTSMRLRKEKEARGVRDLLAGTYTLQ
ncbi:MAG: YdcF family protein [Candidatus Pacebacteria bacterium]|nr:YdcF family protein [Candidatus Paceibacterota bacterium]MBP9842564.1 YdcF family protein [Candidatus Paceibacterota bacterium]